MVLRDLDWKNQPRHIVDWFIVVVAVVLLVVYLSLWGLSGRTDYVIVGLLFVAWLSVFFTGYWQPILYLLTAVGVGFLTVGLFVGGAWEQPLGQVAILLNGVFILTSGYLFLYED